MSNLSDPRVPSDAERSVATIGGAMTVSEFLRWASIGRTKFYAELKSKRLVARKLGTKTIVLRDDAQRWLNSLPTSAS
jgi:hypothetical protein